MSITLEISPELEAKLVEEASRRACPLEAIALQAIQDSFGEEGLQHPLSHEEWRRELSNWITGHPAVKHIVDDSRESIYGDEGR